MSKSIQAQREIVAANEANIRAELAKMGIAFDCGDSRSDIAGHRADMRRAVNAVRARQFDRLGNNKKLSGDELEAYDRDMKLMDGLGAMIEIDNIILELESMGNQDTGTPSANSWRGRGGELRALGKRDRMANAYGHGGGFGFGEYVSAMVSGTENPDIRAALSEGTDSAGGYTVPKRLMAELIDAMRAKTVAIQAGAITIPLETEKTTIARLDSDPQAGWRLESGAVALSDPTFGAVTFQARSLACLVKVSRELLEDSINIDAALMQAFAGAMAGEVDRVALFGSGTAPEPRGLMNTAGVSTVDMGANGAAITGYGKMLDAVYELENANAGQASAWVMAPRTSRALNGLTDTTGQPLNAPKVISDIPRLVSTVVPVNQTHGTATNASSIIVGDFSQLLIGVRTQLRIEVLREAFASTMEYAFLAHLRADIAVAQPKGFAIIKGVTP